MPLTQAEIDAKLLELESRIADMRAEHALDAFVVEEVIRQGESIASQAGDRADWVEDQVTVILAKHGLIEEGPIDEGDWEV